MRMWRNRQTRAFQVRMPQGVWVQVPSSAVQCDTHVVSHFFVRKIKSDNLLTDIAAFILIIVLLSVANRLEYHHASKHKQFEAFD